MVVNFEFLGTEPIENVITCMNFKIDKVVYFGYQETIDKYKNTTINFLKKYCNIGENNIEFWPLSPKHLPKVLTTMRTRIEEEKSAGNDIYFDITGGESLILVAFGILSKEYETPMHMFDIEANKIIELEEGATACISNDVGTRECKLSLDMLIEMHGGVINYDMQKNDRQIDDIDTYAQEIKDIYEIEKQHSILWNLFSAYLAKQTACANRDNHVNIKIDEMKSIMKTPNWQFDINELDDMLKKLCALGTIDDYSRNAERIKFRFPDERRKQYLCGGGLILELLTFLKEKDDSDEIGLGMHLDWDGRITKAIDDVYNEVDVISLKGNIPTFISCKSGNMKKDQTLQALYELDLLANRFGGKYAKRVLVCTQELGETYLERAKEMGIEVRQEI